MISRVLSSLQVVDTFPVLCAAQKAITKCELQPWPRLERLERGMVAIGRSGCSVLVTDHLLLRAPLSVLQLNSQCDPTS